MNVTKDGDGGGGGGDGGGAAVDPRQQALKHWLNTTDEGRNICRLVNWWSRLGRDVRIVGNEYGLSIQLDLRTRSSGGAGRKELALAPPQARGVVRGHPRGVSVAERRRSE